MNFAFLDELNDNQREAVVYTNGPSLVIAGAGSGKTRVLTYKIAYLLKSGYHPGSILALTFTNKAAREMKERIAGIVGYNTARYLWMGTFHAIFSRMLRMEAQYIGYTRNFTIYDSSDSKNLIKTIVKDLKLDDKVYKPGLIQSRISYAKNNLITSQAYAADTDIQKGDSYSKIPMLKDIYDIYGIRCKQAGAMDFDDLLLHTNLLFRNHPEILYKYQQAFRCILVDEYQDTNFAQYLIVKKLAESHKQICVVGDDAQSIYSFRGANIDNILQFKHAYPDARIFKLERNYRSTQNIVNAANSLIEKNSAQIKKTIFSEKEKGEPVKVTNVYTDLEEGNYVADSIRSLYKKDNYNYQQIAVLYRTNAQSRVIEEALRRQSIPYRIYGGLSFYQRKEIKDVVAYFRLVSNHNDEEALKRIINYPARGIGETTLKKLSETAQLHAVSVWEVLTDMLKYNLSVNTGTAKKLAEFRDMIDRFSAQISELNAYELAQSIIRTTGVISNTLADRSPENLSRQENIQELLKAIHEFCGLKLELDEKNFYLPDYLAEISLLTDQDTDNEANKEKISLMTVHAAKGLEFKVVFIVGMEEELFPSPFCIESARELEEERRLFYVAITRAEERCFISFSRSRFRNGKTNFSNPSRFIKDIDGQYLDYQQEEQMLERPKLIGNWDNEVDSERTRFNYSSRSNGITEQINTATIPKRLTKLTSDREEKINIKIPTLPVGTKVRHQVFGVGKILETSIVSGNEKAEIDFGDKGVKSLLLKYAKLEILD